jgi:RNA polymerase sigma-70 factor (ECF subfamily)
MATKSVSLSLPTEDSPLSAGMNQPPPLSPEVLQVIYNTHYRHVLQVCRGFFRHREDAEDAAAEVFLKLYRVLHQKDQTIPFRPWVSQVAGHHCIDKLRRKKRENSLSLEEVDVSGFVDHGSVSPLSQVLRNESEARIREHLARLPQRHKTALVLRYYKRMSYSEIARALNTHLPAVRVMIFRAKNCLRRSLERSERASFHLRLLKAN